MFVAQRGTSSKNNERRRNSNELFLVELNFCRFSSNMGLVNETFGDEEFTSTPAPATPPCHEVQKIRKAQGDRKMIEKNLRSMKAPSSWRNWKLFLNGRKESPNLLVVQRRNMLSALGTSDHVIKVYKSTLKQSQLRKCWRRLCCLQVALVKRILEISIRFHGQEPLELTKEFMHYLNVVLWN